jgi:hypothetical protein
VKGAARQAVTGAVVCAALLGGAGCGVPLGTAAGLSPVNTCSSAGDCAAGSTCAQGACVATSYDLTGLLLEVHPLADATYGASTSFLIDPAAEGVVLASQGEGAPFITSFDAQLPAEVSIQNGLVLLDPSTACPVPGQGIPATLTFYRLSPFGGLSFDPVTVSSTSAGGTDPYTYSVDLVPGTYDVYIEPQAIKGCNDGFSYPPAFFPSQMIDAGGATPWQLPPVSTLGGSITGLAVGVWKVDLVEPSRGLPISSVGALDGQPGGVAVSAEISWPDASLAPILRLTPLNPAQAGAPQPSIYWTLEGAVFSGTQDDPVVGFEVAGLEVAGVEVGGQLLDQANAITGPASLLTFQSQSLFGDNAGNAAFSISNVPATAMGAFETTLPPGDYAIRAVPLANDPFSVSDFTLSWPASSGQTFTMQPKVSLGGAILTSTGEALAGTFVGVAPSATPVPTFLADTHQLDPQATRPFSSTTGAAGDFSFSVDQGSSDLVVQPDPSTRLPWLVRPKLVITPGLSLSTLALTSPAFLGGTVIDPHGMPVANAEINAWLPVVDPGSASAPPSTVVKIATTSTDANGVFSLVLPSSL